MNKIAKKGIIFFVPNWEKPTELWLNRMILNLEDVLIGVVCPNPQSRFWGNKIPAFSSTIQNTFFIRVLKKFLSKSFMNDLNDKYLLRRFNANNIHSVSIHYLTLAVTNLNLVLKIKKPVFIHCHGYDVSWDLIDPMNPQKKFHSNDYVEKVKKLGGTSFFIANSINTFNNLKKIEIPEERIHICNFGIQVRNNFEKPASIELTILYLGRLIDCKGPELVMIAFDLACKKGLSARLVLAGDGPLRVTCELLKRDLEYGHKIEILGEVSWEKGQALLLEANIFTAHNRKGPLTNQEEAFGVSIVEAMAVGIPVITGRNGGCIETIIENVTGILIEPGDIEAHADAFLLLGKNADLRTKLGEQGRERVRENYSPERERKRLLEIYGI